MIITQERTDIWAKECREYLRECLKEEQEADNAIFYKCANQVS
jgi:hypothetical protein